MPPAIRETGMPNVVTSNANFRHRLLRVCGRGRARDAHGDLSGRERGGSYLVRYQNSGVSQNWVWLAMEACGPDSVFFHTVT
jgi:hypothetical protein